MKKLFIIPFAIFIGLLFLQGKSTLKSSASAPNAPDFRTFVWNDEKSLNRLQK
jgi:hypothetical protein